ncbi:MAG: STAS domain-containing protein [Bacteroidales bacterium]|jgi:anti-sigma B factor antagonist|nr:STAS domain-containing protein [Bacteroidales bacterium]MBR1488747.1 STAS domain-containing protein [Bacteroidales bacterium]MDO4999038.1 STAS domain-containing protein [Bacteroidales bacterium]
MEINITNNGDSMVCTLAGRLDTPASLQVSKDIQPLLDNADKEIVLDCTDLEYISSSGLRILLGIRKETARKGGKVILKHIREEIRQVFLMTGFYNLFEIQDS